MKYISVYLLFFKNYFPCVLVSVSFSGPQVRTKPSLVVWASFIYASLSHANGSFGPLLVYFACAFVRPVFRFDFCFYDWHSTPKRRQWTVVAAGCGPPTFLHRFPKNICIWKQHLPPSKKDRDADKDLGDLLLGSGSGSPSIAFTFPARLYFYCQPNVPQVASWWWPVQWLKERVRVPHLIL